MSISIEIFKFCRDCQHASRPISNMSKCERPGSAVRDENFLVTGEGTPFIFFYCSTERKMEGETSCGPGARFFKRVLTPEEERALENRLASDAIVRHDELPVHAGGRGVGGIG